MVSEMHSSYEIPPIRDIFPPVQYYSNNKKQCQALGRENKQWKDIIVKVFIQRKGQSSTEDPAPSTSNTEVVDALRR